MREAPINLNQIESHLWESANIPRGPVDAAEVETLDGLAGEDPSS